MEAQSLIAKGAEADLWHYPNWNGINVLIKRRGVKSYRVPELDKEIRSYRTAHEASIINRAKYAGVQTPLIYQINLAEATIVMEYIQGDRVKDIVDYLNAEERQELFYIIGKTAGRLHSAGIIHGDLTTSNMIKREGDVVFIDFGLGEVSWEVEKRGVDLNLMYRMLTSTHFNYTDELFQAFKKGYRSTLGEEADIALNRMEEIGKRGRYVERE